MSREATASLAHIFCLLDDVLEMVFSVIIAVLKLHFLLRLRPNRVEALSDDAHLTSVCRVHRA